MAAERPFDTFFPHITPVYIRPLSIEPPAGNHFYEGRVHPFDENQHDIPSVAIRIAALTPAPGMQHNLVEAFGPFMLDEPAPDLSSEQPRLTLNVSRPLSEEGRRLVAARAAGMIFELYVALGIKKAAPPQGAAQSGQ